MSSKKIYYSLIILCGILFIAFVGAIVGGNYLFQQYNESYYNLKVRNEAIDRQQQELANARRDIETYQEIYTIAKTVVPQEKDQARTVRELVNIANSSGININSITFPSSNLGQVPPTPTTPAPAPESAASSAPQPPAAPPSQAQAVEGLQGVFEIEVNIAASEESVSFDRLITFLEKLEQNRRTSQVKNVSITPDQANRNLVTFTLSLSVFIKP
jgi:hypothetical protein